MIASVVALGVSSLAQAQANFDQMVTFGDSLTHNDLLWLVYGSSPDLYGNDPNQAVFNKARLSGDDLDSYAIAGSESDDVVVQIDLYDFSRLIGLQDRATMLGFEIGGNDFLNNDSLLASAAPGENAQADAVVDNLLGNLRSDLIGLSANHPNVQLIIWTVPDIVITPENWGRFSPTGEANIRAHLERVNRQIRRLDRFSNVVVFDLYAHQQDLLANPPVLFDVQLNLPPAYGDFDDLFADTIHPTAVANALMANEMISQINDKWNENIPLYTDEELADLARIDH